MVIHTLKHMPLWGNAEDFKDKSKKVFQWPMMEDIESFPEGPFHMKKLQLKSAFDGLNSGICSVRVELTNECTSPEIKVDGVDSKLAQSLDFPSDPQKVKQAIAYDDQQGVFNIYLMDKSGNAVSHYDPKNYGKPKYGQKL